MTADLSEDQRWALVTGGSSGTGAAICRALAQESGLNIFTVHRGNHPEEAAEVARTVREAGRRYEELIGEAGKFDDVEKWVEEIVPIIGVGNLQIFVHSIANASIGNLVVGPALLHPKQINKTFESMAHSFVFWTRGLVQNDLIPKDGRVLALTNAITESNLANTSGIAAAKAALEMYVKYMAMELGPKEIRCNALRFSTAETTALQWIFPDGDWEKVRDFHQGMSPAGRMIALEEVAALVTVLAGDKGRWFNSAVIDFTGGQMHGLYQQITDHILGKNN